MRIRFFKIMLIALSCLLATTAVKADEIDLKELRFGYENHLVSSGNEANYCFHLNQPMVVVIDQAESLPDSTSLSLYRKGENDAIYSLIMESHDKSRIKQTMNLWNRFENSSKIIQDTVAMKESQGFLCLALNAGDYELTSKGHDLTQEAPCGGVLRTNIYALGAKATIEDPVVVSIKNGGRHHWNSDFRNAGTLFYLLDLTADMTLDIEAYGTYSQLTLLDDKQQPLMSAQKDKIMQTTLKSGKYFLKVNHDSGDCTSGIDITWKEPVGNSLEHPIELGIISDPYFEADPLSNNMSLFTDTYGEKEKEVVMTFSIEHKVHFDAFIFYSSALHNSRVFLTLLNNNKEVLCHTASSNFSVKMNNVVIEPGTYYLVCEGGETDGSLICQLSFFLWKPQPDEPDVPQPEPEVPEEPETPENYSPSTELNYIRTITPTMSCAIRDTFAYLSNAEHQIHYYDGMGRPIQKQAYKASPDRKDLVFNQEYDLLGRDGKQWLSLIRQDESASGKYIASETIVSKAKEQYKDNCPFNYPVYDGSPLNRVVEQYGPGEAWQQGGYSTKSKYRINVINDRCLNFGVNGVKGKPELMLKGFFSPNELEVTETEDEDGHATFRFIDKNGNAILQRNITENDTLDTYYVYDVYSNLCFVLPPAATGMVALLSPFNSSPQEILDKYAYQYYYDYRDRCIGKQLPGCGKTEQIYDVNNRLIFTQDGEQKKRTEWSFQLFDTLNRTVLSGIYHGTPDRQECSLQNVYVSAKSDDSFIDPDYDPDQPIEEFTLAGYILHCPSSINSDSLEVLKANYYDSYDYKNKVSGFGSSLDYAEDENYGKRYANGEQTPLNCKDLLTSSMVRILDTDQMLYSCFYYDYNRNLVQDRHTTVNGKTAVSKSAFNFCSQPTATSEEYDDSIRLGKRYTYDHAKRLTKETHTIGNDTICFLYSYDETGRIQSLTRINGNDSLTTTNSYNIRDWLTAIDSPVFKQSLHYTDGVGTPCYNGNVSSMTWQTDSLATRGYQFSYDGLSRLKAAVYGEGSSLTDNLNRFGEQVTGYDKMGNILGIKRHGQTAENDYGIIDNLSLTYNGNQLEAVNDNATHTAFNNSFEFKDGAKQTIEYIYDANGNLTQDLNKKITDIQYNCLNLPRRIQFEDGNTISFLYDANGTKLRATHIIDGITTTTDYCDNAIYEKGTLDKLMTEYGYVTLSDTTYHYFVQDHQGNNRAVVNQNGTVEEVNHFYPFGGVFASTASIQPYKYNGKELDRRNGLNWYDYGARMYDPLLGRFVTTDPLAESSYMVNPYAYCMNNPFNRVDPSGMASHYNWDTNRYEDEAGNEVSWESVQQEYGIAKSEGQSNDDPPSRDDVDGITGAARRVNSDSPMPEKATIITPVLPWWIVTGEIFGSATVSNFGAFLSIITLLQSDTDGPVYVNEANKVKKKKSSSEADYGKPAAEHTKNKNKRNKHEKGRKRVGVDRGGEKGDTRRTRYK